MSLGLGSYVPSADLGSEVHSKGISITSPVILNPLATSGCLMDADNQKMTRKTNGFGVDTRGTEMSNSDTLTSNLDPFSEPFIFKEKRFVYKGPLYILFMGFILILVSCITIYIIVGTMEPINYYFNPDYSLIPNLHCITWNASSLNPYAKCYIPRDSVYSSLFTNVPLLSSGMGCSSPRIFHDPLTSIRNTVGGDINQYITPNVALDTTPECIETHTPNVSLDINPECIGSDISVLSLVTSPECLETETPNVSSSITVGNTFVSNDSTVIGNVTSSSEVTGNDKDLPHSILQNLRLKNVNKIIIGHININSIRNKIHLLADMIMGRVDILLISETKLDSTFPKPQFFIQGFSEPLRLDRTATGGGLLLYLRDDIPSKPLPLILGNIECLISEVTISKKKWVLIGSYNPNKSLISKHMETLETSLCHYLSLYDNVILFGDFNSEIGEEVMDDFCNLYNLKSLIKVPTCFKSTERPSCIDLILTNKPHNFQHSTALETGLSDFHLLTVTVLKSTFRKKPPKIIKYRNYKNYTHTNFQSDLLSSLTGIDLMEISNDEYVSLCMKILDRHAPIKTKYIRGNDQPFITKELRKEHMKRSRLKNSYQKNKSDENLLAYRKQRNLCVNLLKKVKRSYFENLRPSDICDNKKFWKTVKPLFSEKPISTENITLIENNVIVTEDEKVANIFNSCFSNAVKNLNIEYNEHCSFDKYFLCKETENEDFILRAIDKFERHPSILKIKEMMDKNSNFSFKPTDFKSVIKEFANLDESKATPIESIPAKILKDNYNIIGRKVVIDFNSSIISGIFPHNQKLADISPIFKNDTKFSKHNYRPVSILSALSKISERLMMYQIDDYMKDKLSMYLCGFRKGMSAQNCLLFMVEKWRKSLDKAGKCGVLLTDLSKSFDCLVHDLLIAKLHAYGFDYRSLKLIYSYLTGRLQRVRINASFSSWREIFTGVPQGSVLGPELYNINSNDLFLFMLLDIANYADDNSPFSIAPTIPKVLSQLKYESATLLQWIGNNGLKANPGKFHLLLSDKNEEYSLKVESSEVKNSKSQKLLGITIDNKLTFDDHVSSICTKASQKLHALSRVSNFMTFKQRKIIMNTFISSQFGYCPLVWMFHSRKLNNRINRLHERALRVVYNDDKSSFEELLTKDESFTVHERNIQTMAIELYKVAYGLSPKIMNLIFPLKDQIIYPTENIFKTCNVKTVSWGSETLYHLGPKIWSIVPNDMKKFSLSKFTKKIRKWKPLDCPCRMCKTYIHGLGFITISS